ncbi:MAG: glycosyltransferase family 39 protein [Candidatus Sumerlaeia bacterium]|nr:glycosyltransferase family 39 protein [Candidatus Sumerlaeia bacterium]
MSSPSMATWHQRRAGWGLLGIAGLLVLVFGFQGSRGLYSPDEGFYISIAQEMVHSGDWMVPRLHQVTWLDKPPLSLWGIAVGLKAFGQNEWGARAFHALSHALTVLVVFLLGCAMGTRRDGWLGAAMYATMAIPAAAANMVTPDGPLALWTTLSCFCFWKSANPKAQRVVLWKLLMCGALGLGFLTKGPAALIPTSAMFVYLLLRGQVRAYFVTAWAMPCALLFAVLGLGWYAWIAREVPGAMAYFLDNQVIGRTVSTKYGRNTGLIGAFIYVPVLIAGTLPWSAVWWPVLWRHRGELRSRALWRRVLDDPERLLLLLWVAVPILILMLASSRLPFYALPTFPALALLTARLIPPSSIERNPFGLSSRALGLAALWCLVLLGAKAATAHYPHEKDMRALYLSIKDDLPHVPHEIVAVDEQLAGLGFYHPARVKQVTLSDEPYPFFVLPDHLADAVQAMRASGKAHVVLCRRDRRAEEIHEELARAGIAFEERKLAHKRFLFLCAPAASNPGRPADSPSAGTADSSVTIKPAME